MYGCVEMLEQVGQLPHSRCRSSLRSCSAFRSGGHKAAVQRRICVLTCNPVGLQGRTCQSRSGHNSAMHSTAQGSALPSGRPPASSPASGRPSPTTRKRAARTGRVPMHLQAGRPAASQLAARNSSRGKTCNETHEEHEPTFRQASSVQASLWQASLVHSSVSPRSCSAMSSCVPGGGAGWTAHGNKIHGNGPATTACSAAHLRPQRAQRCRLHA